MQTFCDGYNFPYGVAQRLKLLPSCDSDTSNIVVCFPDYCAICNNAAGRKRWKYCLKADGVWAGAGQDCLPLPSQALGQRQAIVLNHAKCSGSWVRHTKWIESRDLVSTDSKPEGCRDKE